MNMMKTDAPRSFRPRAILQKLETFARRTEPLVAPYQGQGLRVTTIPVTAEMTFHAMWRVLNDRD